MHVNAMVIDKLILAKQVDLFLCTLYNFLRSKRSLSAFSIASTHLRSLYAVIEVPFFERKRGTLNKPRMASRDHNASAPV